MRAEPWNKTESERSGRWNHFPNSTIARYDQLTQAITLHEIDSQQFMSALESDDPIALRKVLPVFYHELRHWIDHVATVWGRRDLINAFVALNAKASGTEADLWRITEYHREASRDRFKSYYTVIENRDPSPGLQKVWKWSLSTGARFNSEGRLDETKPIVFTRFRWPDDKLAVRVPFSIASLLEISAMYFEWGISLGLTAKMKSSAMEIQHQAFLEQAKSYLFDPELAEYSVGVHIVANLLRLNDPILAFKLASALASVALNLLDDMFESLKVPETFARWGDRNCNLIIQRDRGFAFLILAHFAPGASEDTDVMEWLDQTVQNAGLESLAKLEARSLQFKLDMRVESVEGELGRELRNMLAKGDLIASRCGIFPKPLDTQIALQEARLPPIILSDLGVFDLRERLDSNGVNEFLGRLKLRTDLIWDMTEFVEACGM